MVRKVSAHLAPLTGSIQRRIKSETSGHTLFLVSGFLVEVLLGTPPWPTIRISPWSVPRSELGGVTFKVVPKQQRRTGAKKAAWARRPRVNRADFGCTPFRPDEANGFGPSQAGKESWPKRKNPTVTFLGLRGRPPAALYATVWPGRDRG